jgi:hypothetical protein
MRCHNKNCEQVTNQPRDAKPSLCRLKIITSYQGTILHLKPSTINKAGIEGAF